jgi:hypothetical protein
VTQWRPDKYSCKHCVYWKEYRNALGICNGTDDHHRHVLEENHTICSGFSLKGGE